MSRIILRSSHRTLRDLLVAAARAVVLVKPPRPAPPSPLERRVDSLLATVDNVRERAERAASLRGLDAENIIARAIASFWQHYHAPAQPVSRRKRTKYANWCAAATVMKFCRRHDRRVAQQTA